MVFFIYHDNPEVVTIPILLCTLTDAACEGELVFIDTMYLYRYAEGFGGEGHPIFPMGGAVSTDLGQLQFRTGLYSAAPVCQPGKSGWLLLECAVAGRRFRPGAQLHHGRWSLSGGGRTGWTQRPILPSPQRLRLVRCRALLWPWLRSRAGLGRKHLAWLHRQCWLAPVHRRVKVPANSRRNSPGSLNRGNRGVSVDKKITAVYTTNCSNSLSRLYEKIHWWRRLRLRWAMCLLTSVN